MIVDFHTHVFPPEIIARRDEFVARDVWLGELYGNPKAKMATVDDLLASMETNQIDAAVTFPFGWRDSGLARECNSYIIQAMSDHPGRIIGLASVQPLAGRHAVAELERCRKAGMPGFGELMPHGQGYRLSDTALLAPLVEAATQLGMFALTHASEPVGHLYQGKGDVTPAELEVFLRAFPDLLVVAAHWGGGLPFYELMPEVQEEAANVWYDSAASPFLYRPEIFAYGRAHCRRAQDSLGKRFSPDRSPAHAGLYARLAIRARKTWRWCSGATRRSSWAGNPS